MKRVVSVIMALSFVLMGCGSQAETEVSTVPDAPQTEATAPTAEEKPEEMEIITEATPETVIVRETVVVYETVIQTVIVPEKEETTRTEAVSPDTIVNDSPVTDKETVIRLYKNIIEDKFVSLPEMGSIEYSLYDMNYDGVPELLLKYGTCEADYRIDIYSCWSNQLVTIEKEIGGGHTSFAYDYKANQLVLANGHMGYGIMSWYDLDQEGNLRFLIDTGEFMFGGEGYPEYAGVMKKYNVAYLPMSTTFRGIDGLETYVYFDMNAGDVESQVYKGLDYTLLERYQF